MSKSEARLARKLAKNQKSKTDRFASTSLNLPTSSDKDDHIIISLQHLVEAYGLNTKHCNDQIRSDLLQKLHTMCKSTWTNLILKGKNCGGLERLKVDQFKVPLPAIITDDVKHLYVIRFNAQNSRLIGHRDGNIFHAILVDVGLSSYDH